jgi:hypothetical protein
MRCEHVCSVSVERRLRRPGRTVGRPIADDERRSSRGRAQQRMNERSSHVHEGLQLGRDMANFCWDVLETVDGMRYMASKEKNQDQAQ